MDISTDSSSEDSLSVLLPPCRSSPTDTEGENHLENEKQKRTGKENFTENAFATGGKQVPVSTSPVNSSIRIPNAFTVRSLQTPIPTTRVDCALIRQQQTPSTSSIDDNDIMAENIENYDSQVNASNTFVQKLATVPVLEKEFDITGWNARKVIGLLKSIVNDREKYTKYATFILKINDTKAPTNEAKTTSFQLKAFPTKHQPGNGLVTNITTNASPTHNELFENLNEEYENDTCWFAQDIKRVFANNSKIFKVPEVTRDAYMLLLFEIGRRLVTDDSGYEKKRYDELPIASAITSLVKLMETSQCTFEDVFSVNGKLHCFTGEPEVRKNAILNSTPVTL